MRDLIPWKGYVSFSSYGLVDLLHVEKVLGSSFPLLEIKDVDLHQSLHVGKVALMSTEERSLFLD